MTRLELLENPIFKGAPSALSCMFVVNILQVDTPIVGISNFRKDLSTHDQIVFDAGYPVMTKEEMEKILLNVRKSKKKWNPKIAIGFTNEILELGSCDVVATMDHNLVLRSYWIDKNGNKVYFDNNYYG